MLLDRHSLNDAMQASLAFAISQTASIEVQINEIEYPDIVYDTLVPVSSSAHPFAKTITFYSMDSVGRAGFVNGNSNDIPMVDLSMNSHEEKVLTSAVGYYIGWEEAGQAQMHGFNLDSEKAGLARRAAEEHCDRIALSGDSGYQLSGLFNTAGIDKVTFAAGETTGGTTFGLGATGMNQDEICDRVNSLISGVITDSLKIEMADTILMPLTTFNYLSSKRMPDGVPGTVLDWIKKYNPYTAHTGKELDIRGLIDLETAGTGGIKRMVAYRKAPDVLKFHKPMDHQFLPPQPTILNIAVPGVQRIGGTEIRKPLAVRYAEGF